MIANATSFKLSTQEHARIRRGSSTPALPGENNVRDRGPAQVAIKRKFLLDKRAFEEFAEQFAPKLLSVAKRFLRNEDDAADAVQDAFLAALSSIQNFKGESSVYTWMYRILVNVCLMKLRSSTRDRCVSFEFIERISDGRELREATASLADMPQSQLESDDLVQLVRDCIKQLPSDYRNIILLRDIEQFDTDQTARLLHVSRGVVKTRLHRARRALRAMIEQEVGNPCELNQALCNFC